MTIPGVKRRSAECFVAEIGVDMSIFPTAKEPALFSEQVVEAGVWSVEDAERLATTGLAGRATRVLVEVMGGEGEAAAASARDIDVALDGLRITTRRLHHGEHAATWPVLHRAVTLRRDVRIGLEDTLALPDGEYATDNAQLVATVAALLTDAT